MTNSRCKFPMLDMRFYLLPDTRTAGSHLRHWKSGTLLVLWKLQIEDILLAASLFVNGTFSTMGILQFCEAGSACGLFGWRYHKCIGGIFIQTWPYGLLGWRYHQTQFRNPYLCNHLFTNFNFLSATTWPDIFYATTWPEICYATTWPGFRERHSVQILIFPLWWIELHKRMLSLPMKYSTLEKIPLVRAGAVHVANCGLWQITIWNPPQHLLQFTGLNVIHLNTSLSYRHNIPISYHRSACVLMLAVCGRRDGHIYFIFGFEETREYCRTNYSHRHKNNDI